MNGTMKPMAPSPRGRPPLVLAVASCVAQLTACAFWELDATWSDATDAGPQAEGGGVSAEGGAADAHDGGPASYPELVLADRPLGYWKLDETTGTIAHDSSGNGHDGVVDGAVSWNAPRAVSGSAATFSGGTMTIANGGAPFDFIDRRPFTIEAWATPSVIDFVYRRIVSMERPGPPRDGYNVFVVADNAPSTVAFELLSNDRNVVVGTAVSTGTTVHVVAVYDGSSAVLYANGVLVGSKQDDAAVVHAHPGRMMWGASIVGGPANFVGVLDELAVYDHALDAGRVASHFEAGRR